MSVMTAARAGGRPSPVRGSSSPGGRVGHGEKRRAGFKAPGDELVQAGPLRSKDGRCRGHGEGMGLGILVLFCFPGLTRSLFYGSIVHGSTGLLFYKNNGHGSTEFSPTLLAEYLLTKLLLKLSVV